MQIVMVNNVKTVRGRMSSYVHLLCFSRDHVMNGGWLTPDLLPHRGRMLWKRGMGLRAAEAAIRYIALHVPHCHTVLDPFCGSGSSLAMANVFGLHAIGVDHSRKRCQQAVSIDIGGEDISWDGVELDVDQDAQHGEMKLEGEAAASS
jgi:hypothetical protein